MISIARATKNDFELLADIGQQSFLESHGESAEATDIDAYVKEKYSRTFFRNELNEPLNIYHIIYYNEKPAGYSKIILNCAQPNIPVTNINKLERLYLLKDFYDLKLGIALLRCNAELSKDSNQAGMWLFVWKDNLRAVNFYTKSGFKIIGSYEFKISGTHSNPNHQMFWEY
jgi:diamine N-acetyltransferase